MAKSQNHRGGEKEGSNNLTILSGSTTANNTLMTQMMYRTPKTYQTNSFKEAMKRGVVSGVGLLK